MASENGWRAGGEVGWHVRFDRTFGKDTRILCMTPGLLLRRLQDNPFLEGVGAVVFDEFHERGLDTDLGLALLAEVRRDARPDLQLVVMSATLDAERIAAWMQAPVVHSEGRSFEVALEWLPRPDDRRVADQVADGVRRALAETEGDVLAFLPGVREIRWTGERLAGLGVPVVPLYGDLPADQQDAALRPGAQRRVVLATNVAESSVTVPGVRAVVDSGLARRPRFDPNTGLDQLLTGRISAASADQRSGRAGRTAPGWCLRLWTHREQMAMAAFDPPELERISLAGPVLQLLEWGTNPTDFVWFEAPSEAALDHAQALLADLGATDRGSLTPLGHDLARLPLHPRLGRMLVEAQKHGATELGALAAAWMSERDPLMGWRPRGPADSDLLERVMALSEGQGQPGPRTQLMRVAKQLNQAVGRLDRARVSRIEPVEALGRAVLAGWPDRVAMRRDASRRARMTGGKGVVLSERSAVTDALFVCLHIRPDQGDSAVDVASGVEVDWLDVHQRTVLAFDDKSGRVSARRVSAYRDLELSSHPAEVDRTLAGPVLGVAAAADLQRALPRGEGWTRWITRIGWLHDQLGEPWPDPDAAWLADLLPETVVGCRSMAELRKADWKTPTRARLGWELSGQIDRLAPEHVAIPSGRSARLSYSRGEPPVLAVRVQELFGSTHTPTVANGAVRCRMHLLGPHGRPVQITDDLARFWSGSWQDVRKSLRGRYPKHHWPEDPTTADPQRRPRRRY
jgi:ATP-dependent helicase HrpB